MQGGDLQQLVLEAPAWMADAACAGTPTQAFFPARGQPTTEARRLCSTCLVRVECLEYALADPTLSGVWGGLGEIQRRQLRRRRRAA
jgi:WhiB family redox-sensing transcriptional regulator